MFLSKKKKFFVIAEIGHNHLGKLDVAYKMIEEAKRCGADAVKLQKRDNKSLYTEKFYNSLYDNVNSYGLTYGKHREYLEFNHNQYKLLQKFAKKIGIFLFATPFDFASVKFLKKLNMPGYKIASADLINIPLQQEIAKTGKPIILSTGGGNFKDVDRAVKNILKINKNLTVLHCTASYPADYKDMNLLVIKKLKQKYKKLTIGLSDHENGIDAGVVAYMLGARVFEKHFTLNRGQKGTDHAFSLEPGGLERFIRNINRVEVLMGSGNKKVLDSEKKPLYKMQKSIVAAKDLNKGHKIVLNDLSYKSPADGLEPYKTNLVVGKKLKKKLKKDDYILKNNLK